jgi:hypothetical protein
VGAGCDAGPSKRDVQVLVEKLHRDFVRVNAVDVEYLVGESLTGAKSYWVAYQADVEWLETVKYAPALGPGACVLPTVRKRGEPGPLLYALMDPDAYWTSSGTGQVYQKGGHARVSGKWLYKKYRLSWEWGCMRK